MITEGKQLLLKDLCARLPYGVIMNTPIGNGRLNSIDQTIFGTEYGINISVVSRDFFNDSKCEVKPYLRPMSSMTEDERYDYRHMLDATLNSEGEPILFVYVEDFSTVLDWLNEHHFDYRGLIEKGLALEALEGMYD